MSRYTFLASPHPLPEIDHSGFIRLKVKDLKKMNYTPAPNSPISWGKLDDEAEVLYAASEDDIGGLKISVCKNPPNGLEHYISEKFVYWVEVNYYKAKFSTQLIDYLQANIQKESGVKLWSIWFGDYVEIDKKEVITLKAAEISSKELAILLEHDCCCICFE